jgi:chromosome segregation ATPase
METIKRFLESYASFYKAFRQASEEYFKNVQIATRSDLARVAELVVALEEKIDRIEDALEDAQDERQQWSTQQGVISETISGLVGRLGMVESKVDVLPAALQKIEAANNVEHLTDRLSHVESKVDTLPTALQKIEAANNVEHLTERMNRIESKLDTLLAALEKIEAKANTANIKPTSGTQRKSQKKAADAQVSNNTAKM